MRRSARSSRLDRADDVRQIAAHSEADGYTWRDIDRLLGLSRHIVTRLIEAGFVVPSRGARREYRFTFQDLVVLRAAHALVRADIPTARILRSLRSLRSRLPEEVPLAGLSIQAVGSTVAVRERDSQWVADDGQYLLQFDVVAPGGRLAFFEKPAPPFDWFRRAVELEASDATGARHAYAKAIDANPNHRDAYVNLGYLLHESGDLCAALDTYRTAVARCEPDAMLLFNLAVVEEDLGRMDDAAMHYRDALRLDPAHADAHFNLARLCEQRGAQQEALRHWNAYRKLSK